jgi:hypothetical protein
MDALNWWFTLAGLVDMAPLVLTIKLQACQAQVYTKAVFDNTVCTTHKDI